MQDYCTWWPEGSWAACCQAHDLAYAGEGARMAADLDLAACVYETTHNGPLALLMLAGVVICGGLFRWHGRRKAAMERPMR